MGYYNLNPRQKRSESNSGRLTLLMMKGLFRSVQCAVPLLRVYSDSCHKWRPRKIFVNYAWYIVQRCRPKEVIFCVQILHCIFVSAFWSLLRFLTHLHYSINPVLNELTNSISPVGAIWIWFPVGSIWKGSFLNYFWSGYLCHYTELIFIALMIYTVFSSLRLGCGCLAHFG